jgi:hypothetical protein
VIPTRHHTVDRTGIRVTFLGLDKTRASDTTVFGWSCNGAASLLLAVATGLGASAPDIVVTDDTVDGARRFIAEPRLAKERAGVTSVLSTRQNLSVTVLSTSPTCFGASRPLSELADFAVNWARAVSTSLTFFEGWAHIPTERMIGDDSTFAPLRSLSTRSAALAPCSEIVNHTVDWAWLGVAHPSV